MERKTWAEIKAENAAKREAKGKPPVKTLAQIGEERSAYKDQKRARKLDRKAEKALAKQGIRPDSAGATPVEGGGDAGPFVGSAPPARTVPTYPPPLCPWCSVFIVDGEDREPFNGRLFHKGCLSDMQTRDIEDVWE